MCVCVWGGDPVFDSVLLQVFKMQPLPSWKWCLVLKTAYFRMFLFISYQYLVLQHSSSFMELIKVSLYLILLCFIVELGYSAVYGCPCLNDKPSLLSFKCWNVERWKCEIKYIKSAHPLHTVISGALSVKRTRGERQKKHPNHWSYSCNLKSV